MTDLQRAIDQANARGRLVAPQGGAVSKEAVQANWDALSEAERAGFAAMGWAPESEVDHG